MVATPRIRSTFLSGPGVWHVEMHGVHDAPAAGRLSVTLGRVARSGSPIVVDLTRTRFVDGSVVNVLRRVQPDVEAAGGTLRVVVPHGRTDPEVLQLPAGLKLYGTVEQALASLVPARRVS